MKTLGHLLRAALLGFLALFAVGGLMMAEGVEKQRAAGASDATNGGGGADVASDPVAAKDPSAEDRGDRAVAGMFAIGLVGALVAVATALLLLLFPVGPASKIVYGVVCGPALPLLIWAPKSLRQDGGDVGGIVLLGMLVGGLVGVLEANRVARARGG